jgi:hypothetical protein
VVGVGDQPDEDVWILRRRDFPRVQAGIFVVGQRGLDWQAKAAGTEQRRGQHAHGEPMEA